MTEKLRIIPDYFQKMAIEDWKDFVSTTATISTVINFMTGLQVSAEQSCKVSTFIRNPSSLAVELQTYFHIKF